MSIIDNDEHNLLNVDTVAIEQYLGALEHAKDKGSWLNAELFASLLIQGMHAGKLAPSELVEQEAISRSSITKWMKKDVTPPQTTRKIVVQWIEMRLKEKLELLKLDVDILRDTA